MIEANPRASRTVPFVAKATGVPLAKVASRVMLGATLAELRAEGLLRRSGRSNGHVAVKEAVLPFNRFPEVDPALGPGDALDRRGDGHRRRRSAGRSTRPSSPPAPCCRPAGTVFLSLADGDKPAGLVVAKRLRELGPGHRRHRRAPPTTSPVRPPGRRGASAKVSARATGIRRPST